MIKNKYIVIGDIAVIFLKLGGSNEIKKMIIDKEDLLLIDKLNSKIRANESYRNCTYAYTAKGQIHRLIMNAPKGKCIDHINHNGLDNRRKNLRIVTDVENQQNRRGPQRNNTSGIYGVNWSKKEKRWEARFMYRGVRYAAGYFKTKEEAAEALNHKKRDIIGF